MRSKDCVLEARDALAGGGSKTIGMELKMAGVTNKQTNKIPNRCGLKCFDTLNGLFRYDRKIDCHVFIKILSKMTQLTPN